MKKKIILSVAFFISLFPMLLNQYGGSRGVQEITGLTNLLNPIGIVSVLIYYLGVWLPAENPVVNTVLGGLGAIGICVSEVYKFFTWHIMTITGQISLQSSLRFAFPEFYLGLAVSVTMVIVYFILDKHKQR